MKVIIFVFGIINFLGKGFVIVKLGILMFKNITNDGFLLGKIKNQHEKKQAISYILIWILLEIILKILLAISGDSS